MYTYIYVHIYLYTHIHTCMYIMGVESACPCNVCLKSYYHLQPFMIRLDKDTLAKSDHLRLIMQVVLALPPTLSHHHHHHRCHCHPPQYGVGLEGVDIEEATRRHIAVSNIPSAQCGNAEATAEHAIYLTMSALRNPNVSKTVFEEGRLGNPLTRQILGKNVTVRWAPVAVANQLYLTHSSGFANSRSSGTEM
jgi:hypothetical protein